MAAKPQRPRDARKAKAATVHEASDATATAAVGRTTLRCAQIRPNPNNPRKEFDSEALMELGLSIAQDGLLQNLLVRTGDADGIHQLVAGERRFRAIGAAIERGLLPPDWPIPVDVRDLTDEQADFLALIENMARKDLKPLEEARHFRLLIDTHGQTTASIAEKTGFTQRLIQQRLQLLELTPADQRKLADGTLTIEQARTKLANRPTAMPFSDSAWLLLLEIHDAMRTRAEGPDKTDYIYVGRKEIGDDANWIELKAKGGWNLLHGPNVEYQEGVDTGRRQISPGYQLAEQIRLRFGEMANAEERHMALCRGRAETPEFNPRMGTLPPGEYVTEWLNGPHMVDADFFDRLGARREDMAQAMARREAAATEAAQRQTQAFAAAAAIAAAVREQAPAPLSDFAEAMSGVNDLPWCCDDKGQVTDAKAQIVLQGGYGQDYLRPMVLRHKLLTIAVNAAGGLATPEKPASLGGGVEGLGQAEEAAQADDDLSDSLKALAGGVKPAPAAEPAEV